VPPDVVYTTDLLYRKVGATDLHLDLARPAQGAGPFPAVLVFNGGSWMDLYGDRKFCKELLVRLAQRGHVAVAVTHRSAAVAPFPAQIHDAKAAVRWLRQQATVYRIDPDRLGAVGFSSGGHLACLLGSTLPADGLEEPGANLRISSRVHAVAGCYPVSDLTHLRQHARNGKPSWLLSQTTLGVLQKLVPDKQAINWAVKGSPISYARKQTVPTLLVHGKDDVVVPFEQSERYARLLEKAGVSVRLVALPDAGHGFGSGYGGEAGRRCDDAVVEFLERQLRPADKK
jgi:acetyl esterase/lipase